jgi:hypothetical protein
MIIAPNTIIIITVAAHSLKVKCNGKRKVYSSLQVTKNADNKPETIRTAV